jgi:hypothetical protein
MAQYKFAKKKDKKIKQKLRLFYLIWKEQNRKTFQQKSLQLLHAAVSVGNQAHRQCGVATFFGLVLLTRELIFSSLFAAWLFNGVVDGEYAVVVGPRALVVELFLFSRKLSINNIVFSFLFV